LPAQSAFSPLMSAAWLKIADKADKG
jgi:hypothetical protein